MRALFYTLTVITIPVAAQDLVVVLKDSTELPITMTAMSDAQIFTEDGAIALADVAYVNLYSDVDLSERSQSRLTDKGIGVRATSIPSSIRKSAPDDMSYHQAIAVPDKSMAQLYTSAKEWFVYAYKSANNVIQLDDQVNGKLIGKGTFTVPYFGEMQVVRHTVTIEVKDGKYRYFIDQFSINDYPFAELPKGQRKNLGSKAHQHVLDLINSMHNYMRKTVPENEW